MVLVVLIILAQVLDAIHELGHAGGYVVVAEEPDSTVCDGFRSVAGSDDDGNGNMNNLRLGVWTADSDAVPL